MGTFKIKWVLSGNSQVQANSEEDAIKKIEIMDTQLLVSPRVTPNQIFDIEEIKEVL